MLYKLCIIIIIIVIIIIIIIIVIIKYFYQVFGGSCQTPLESKFCFDTPQEAFFSFFLVQVAGTSCILQGFCYWPSQCPDEPLFFLPAIKHKGNGINSTPKKKRHKFGAISE